MGHLRISVPILGHALPKAQVNVEIMVGVKTTSSVGVMTKSQPGSTPTPQNYHHVHFITYSSGDTPHFFHKNSQSCDIPPHNTIDSVTMGPEKELISHMSAIS